MNNSSCTRFVCSNEVHPHHTNKPESSQGKHKLNMHLILTSPMTCREKLITFDERCKPLHKQLGLCGRLMFVRLCWCRWSLLSTWTLLSFDTAESKSNVCALCFTASSLLLLLWISCKVLPELLQSDRPGRFEWARKGSHYTTPVYIPPAW